MRLVVGTVLLDRYRILGPLPWGVATGAEAVALDQRLDRLVTLLLAPEPASTPGGEVCARRAHVVAGLGHPVLPLILDMGVQHGYMVLVYPHSDGQLLADIARHDRGDWDRSRVLPLVADLAAALGLLHAQGLCHGSFSTQSVLVEQNGMVTIWDLTWPRRGTVRDGADVAPEVRQGLTPTALADVFALGQMLRHLLPLSGTRRGGDVDGATAAVVEWATAWAPRERYADGTALAAALRRLVAQPSSPRASLSPSYAGVPAHRARAGATPSARPAAGRTARRGQPALLPAVAVTLGLTLALAPVADAIMHDALGHRPALGFWHGDGHRWPTGWPRRGQHLPGYLWDLGSSPSGQSGPPWGWGTAPDERSP